MWTVGGGWLSVEHWTGILVVWPVCIKTEPRLTTRKSVRMESWHVEHEQLVIRHKGILFLSGDTGQRAGGGIDDRLRTYQRARQGVVVSGLRPATRHAHQHIATPLSLLSQEPLVLAPLVTSDQRSKTPSGTGSAKAKGGFRCAQPPVALRFGKPRHPHLMLASRVRWGKTETGEWSKRSAEWLSGFGKYEKKR